MVPGRDSPDRSDSIGDAVADDAPQRGDAVSPADIFALLAGATVVADGHSVDPIIPPGNAAGDFRQPPRVNVRASADRLGALPLLVRLAVVNGSGSGRPPILRGGSVAGG